MAVLWRTVIFFLCVFIVFVRSNPPSNNDEMHYKRARKVNKRVKMMGKSLEALHSMLMKIQIQNKDQCEASVANITGEIQELSEKIDNLGEVTTGAPDIYLTDNHSDGTPVRVDVTTAFDECYNSLGNGVMQNETAKIWCLRVALWQYNIIEHNEDDEDLQIERISNSTRTKRSSRFIRRQLAPRDMTQPPSGFRVRQEYRTLSLRKRRRFHRALNVLHEDKTMDCFSLVHKSAIGSKGAHRGVAFLPWHRAFISLFEEALRQVDPRVSLPYWDSSIDNNMPGGPKLSVMWDNEHLGQGSGPVNSGPFSGWVTPTNPLRRDIAEGTGSLVRQSKIDEVMGYCRLADFDGPWEGAHNGVHRWIGGTMARSLAASDPVFYMHHCFMDYQWEKFREHQDVDCDIDSAFDYPPTTDVNHAPETRMDGMRYLRNKDGIANYWTRNWYNYEDTPTCANDCGNNLDIFCDEDRNVCVCEISFDLIEGRKKREVRSASPETVRSASNTTTQEVHLRKCRKNPYCKECTGQSDPLTAEEYVERVVRREIEMPREIKVIADAQKRDLEYAESYPPECEPIFFNAEPTDSNDCRTKDTCVFDLLSALVHGKKVTKSKYKYSGYSETFKVK